MLENKITEIEIKKLLLTVPLSKSNLLENIHSAVYYIASPSEHLTGGKFRAQQIYTEGEGELLQMCSDFRINLIDLTSGKGKTSGWRCIPCGIDYDEYTAMISMRKETDFDYKPSPVVVRFYLVSLEKTREALK